MTYNVSYGKYAQQFNNYNGCWITCDIRDEIKDFNVNSRAETTSSTGTRLNKDK